MINTIDICVNDDDMMLLFKESNLIGVLDCEVYNNVITLKPHNGGYLFKTESSTILFDSFKVISYAEFKRDYSDIR